MFKTHPPSEAIHGLRKEEIVMNAIGAITRTCGPSSGTDA